MDKEIRIKVPSELSCQLKDKWSKEIKLLKFEYGEFIEALEDGKTIQFLTSTGEWLNIYSPSFNHPPDSYRIKPEKEYIPFTYKDTFQLLGKVIQMIR